MEEINSGKHSNSNPGWKGRGIPSTGRTLKRIFIYFINLLKKDSFHASINSIRAEFRNLINFSKVIRKTKKVKCPCCNWEGKAFIALANEREITYNSACPMCDSRSRHRGLILLYLNYIEKFHSEIF